MVLSIVIFDIVQPLYPKGKEVRRKIKCSLWSSMYVEVCIYYIDSTTTIVHKYYTAPETMLKREYVYVHTGIIKLFQNLTVIYLLIYAHNIKSNSRKYSIYLPI